MKTTQKPPINIFAITAQHSCQTLHIEIPILLCVFDWITFIAFPPWHLLQMRLAATIDSQPKRGFKSRVKSRGHNEIAAPGQFSAPKLTATIIEV